jgi:hypothetical protein
MRNIEVMVRLRVGATLLLLIACGCSTSTVTVREPSFFRNNGASARSVVTIDSVKLPSPGDMNLHVALKSEEIKQRQEIQVSKVETTSRLNPFGRLCVFPFWMVFGIVTFGECNLYGDYVTETDRREVVVDQKEIRIAVMEQPPQPVRLLFRFAGEEKAFMGNSDKNGHLSMGMRDLVKEAFENTATTDITIEVKCSGDMKRNTMSNKELEVLYLSL